MDNRTLALIVIGAIAAYNFRQTDKYAAEVGYYHGEETAWDIWGDYPSLDECRSAAISRYNQLTYYNRAYSWACLLKNGKGGYASRHR